MNNEEDKNEPKITETKKGNNKPKLIQTKFETPARNRTGSMSKQESLMSFLTPNSRAKSMFAQALEQSVLPHDLDGFGTLDDNDERNEKRKSPPRGSSPDEMKHDKKNKPLTALPLPLFATGTKPKSTGARSKSVSK